MDQIRPTMRELKRRAFFTVRQQPAFYLLIKFLVPYSNSHLMAFLYSYGRWVDDTVDAQILSENEKREFINRQLTLIDALYSKTDVTLNAFEEWYLFFLVKSDLREERRLCAPLHMMFEVFKFDLRRQSKSAFSTKEELDKYVRLIGEGAMELTNAVAFPRVKFPDRRVYELGTGSELAHLLRDLQEDIEQGIINICSEDLALYQIDLNNFRSQSFEAWIDRQTREAQRLLDVGTSAIHQVDSFRARLAWRLFASKYRRILTRIRNQHCPNKQATKSKDLVES